MTLAAAGTGDMRRGQHHRCGRRLGRAICTEDHAALTLNGVFVLQIEAESLGDGHRCGVLLMDDRDQAIGMEHRPRPVDCGVRAFGRIPVSPRVNGEGTSG